MIVEFYKPAGLATEAVTSMVYHRGYSPDHEIERFLPDGSVDLIIDLGERPKFVFDNDSLAIVQTHTRSWVSGIRTRPISISAGWGEPMLVVGLSPSAARRILDLPMYLLADRVIEAEAVFGPEIYHLRERLTNTSAIADCFRIVDSWITRRLGNSVEEPAWLRQAAATIATDPTLRRIDWYARKVGVSGKHLSQTFREHIGISPKQYQRVHRFQTLVRSVAGNGSPDWVGLAHECGLYDQSHLISEFRHFSGFSPVEYLEHRGDILNYVPVSTR